MVHDHFKTPFDDFFAKWPGGLGQMHPGAEPYASTPPPADVERLAKLVKEFREAVAAAEKLDTLLKQKDCVDPEKVQLQARVVFLEALIERLTAK
jgi:hypothetical protein